MLRAEIAVEAEEVGRLLKCLQALYSLSKKVVNIIRGLPEEVDGLKTDLKDIQKSIEAIAREDLQENEARQLKQTKGLAFKMEDIIDDYDSQEESWTLDVSCAPLSLPDEIAICMNCKTIVNHLLVAVNIDQMKSPVQRIKKRLEEEKKKKEARSDGPRSLTETESKHARNRDALEVENIRKLPLLMKKTDIVGFEGPCNKLIRWLEEAQEDQRIVIAVQGMGGTGKSALARKVFLNVTERFKFDCRLWIEVSKCSSDDEMIFENMWKQLPDDRPQQRSSSSFKAEVENYLVNKRYVVVFDDVRDTYFWNENILGTDNRGSKSMVIITTRNKGVVNMCLAAPNVKEHEMEPLPENESLQLFNDTAFRNDPAGPQTYGVSCKAIVKNYLQQFPLGIVVIGREIASKKYSPLPTECTELLIQKNPKIAMVLRSSYEELSENAKSCLLYFGMYPRDHKFKFRRLFRQWAAEGFVKPTSRRKSEEVAQEIMKELINSSLVQEYGQTKKSYQVHYFVHAMILGIIQDLSFCQVITNESSYNGDIIRRLSIGINSVGAFQNFQNWATSEDNQKYSLMRAVLFFTTEDVSKCTCSILSKANRLKVIEFNGAELSEIPNLIFKTSVKLKYLSFRHTKIEKLPTSIENLHNLETLDLRQTLVHEIPVEVGKLTKLQHLLGDDMCLNKLKGSIGAMKFLQTLYSVKIVDDEDAFKLIKELGELTKIRHLRLTNVMKKHEEEMCKSLNRMKALEKLNIVVAGTEDDHIDLQNLEKCSTLHKPRLRGKFSNLPSWIKGHPGLEHQTTCPT